MAGLILLAVAIGWMLLCIALSKALTSPIRPGALRFVAAALVFSGLLVAPIADDILGSRAYQKYCAAADDQVKILATITLDQNSPLYSASGEWRLTKLPPAGYKERDRLSRAAESLLRWDHGTTRPTSSIFPIQERVTSIYDANSDRLLAQFTSYHYRGGFLRSSVLDSANQCFPTKLGSALYPELLVLQRP
jgi:hypothetical protein